MGTDVDSQAIEWCHDNFPFGEFQANSEQPPTGLSASTFGFASAISVFSHLSEASHRSWLQELARVMRPGGLLAMTVHGTHALHRATLEEPVRSMLEITPADLVRANAEIERHGFAFVSQPAGHLDRTLYGVSFVAEDYIRQSCAPDFECLRYEVAALDDWQDLVVLRRAHPHSRLASLRHPRI